MNWKIITPPAVTPVALADAKAHLKVSGTSEDVLIELYLKAATEMAESYCGLKFIDTIVEEVYTRFCDIGLLRFTAAAITSIKYIDTANVEQTVSSAIYSLNTYTTPQLVIRNYGQKWPTDIADGDNKIKVRYTAGFGAAPANVPANIRSGILIILGDLYENREDRVSALPKASQRLLEPWRVCMF